MTVATVLVPTHDHGPTLLRALRSALAQTVTDLEVFVVGDGVPDATRAIVAALGAGDPRLHFFDHPKGPRRGEVYRHAALRHARGDIVCYLTDRDLWLPDHVEILRELLARADFAHTLPLTIRPDGRIDGYTVDLALPADRRFVMSVDNLMPFSCIGHTLARYRRLPHGWRTTPDGIWTDLYMWRQFLADPECRAISGTVPTTLPFPSPPRRHWPLEQRLAELDDWAQRIADEEGRRRYREAVFDWVVRDRAARISHQREELTRMRNSLKWRLGDALGRTPVLGSAVSAVAGLVARRSRHTD